MPGPFFTTNDSEIGRLEQLYIKELPPPASVAGVFLGVVSVVGECVRGPVDRPVEITSEARFLQVFGGRDQGSGGTLVGKVWLALLNKPFGKVVVVRAAAAAAVKATRNFSDVTPTAIIRVDAANQGTWGNNITAAIQAATDGDATHFNLVATYLGTTYTYQNLNTNSTNDNLSATLGSDDGNIITVTKLANGRPLNISATALTSGADGSIADSDFTAAGRGLNLAATYAGVGVVWCAERSNTTIKTYFNTLAAASSDRMFVVCPDASTTSVATAATEAVTIPSDRIIYTFNHPLTLDPQTAQNVTVAPDSWMASILSQTDVDIHPGEEDTKQFTAGIASLTNLALTRDDYITLKAAGICGLERNSGFAFVSGVTTSTTSGKTEIARRRQADYIQLSLANELRFQVKKKNTVSRRESIIGLISGFLGDLKNAERIVQDFQILSAEVNTQLQRDQGIERVRIRVKLIGHILALVLETEIGTTVNIVSN